MRVSQMSIENFRGIAKAQLHFTGHTPTAPMGVSSEFGRMNKFQHLPLARDSRVAAIAATSPSDTDLSILDGSHYYDRSRR
jgi:hypothetical protein